MKWKNQSRVIGERAGDITRTLINSISDSDIVLDVGGAKNPFNRANYVMDIRSYNTRGVGFGWWKEWFREGTWIQQNICDIRWPFVDNKIDFVFCSHTLEHLRDPISVCREMSRVGKAGYIECPSRMMETIYGLEIQKMVGYKGHRWFVEIKDHTLVFTNKPHQIYRDSSLYFPLSFKKGLKKGDMIVYLFWKDEIKASERLFMDTDEELENLKGFVERINNADK